MTILTPLRHQRGEVGKGATGPVSRTVAQKVETERILAELERFAPLPTVVLDIMQAVEDPGSTVANLEAIICRDLAITARVFKLSHSFFYHHNLDAEADVVRHIAAIHVSDCLINYAKVGIPDEVEVLCQVNPNVLAALGIDAQIMTELQRVVDNELPVITDTCDELIRC